MAGEIRLPEQLRLKWENLKKAARKRSAMIRQNNLKTGGGKLYIPLDQTLDRVASMLGATCSGYTVEFGGDGMVQLVEEITSSEAVVEVQDLQPLPELPQSDENNIVLLSGANDISECDGGGEMNFLPKKLLFNTPKNSVKKRRKLSEEIQIAQRDKELAIASYFQAKAEKVELENIKLKLEIEKLKKSE